MANNITINVTINQRNQELQGNRSCTGADRERQPIDRTDEVLVNNTTTFNDLIRILEGNPEAVRAAEFEAEERELEARMEIIGRGYTERGAVTCCDDEGINGSVDSDDAGDTDDTDILVKAKRRPTAPYRAS